MDNNRKKRPPRLRQPPFIDKGGLEYKMGDMIDQALLLEKTTHALTGTQDFHDLAKKAVNLMFKELGDDKLVGVALFRLHEKENEIHSYAYAGMHMKATKDFKPFSLTKDTIQVPLAERSNLLVRTVETSKMQQSSDIRDLAIGMTEEDAARKIVKALGVKMSLAFPIQLKNGRVAGVLVYFFKDAGISPERITLLETFADQLGLSFSNVVAFEKLIAEFRRDEEKRKSALEPDDIPSIKFTLRVTPRENECLEEAARASKRTKADIMRELIDEHLLDNQ